MKIKCKGCPGTLTALERTITRANRLSSWRTYYNVTLHTDDGTEVYFRGVNREEILSAEGKDKELAEMLDCLRG